MFLGINLTWLSSCKVVSSKKKKTNKSATNHINILTNRNPFMTPNVNTIKIGVVIKTLKARHRLVDAHLPENLVCKIPLLRSAKMLKKKMFALLYKILLQFCSCEKIV